MPTYLSPGIYSRETDFSFYVKQISTSSANWLIILAMFSIKSLMFIICFSLFICSVHYLLERQRKCRIAKHFIARISRLLLADIGQMANLFIEFRD